MRRSLKCRRARIASVTMDRGGWAIVDSERTTYRTFNGWIASLADSYRKSASDVDLHFHHGWLHRDLTGITPVTATFGEAESASALICSWCDRIVSEGRRPASHVICQGCRDNMDAELTAKYGIDSQGNPA